ncbi:hypothetical protein ACERK3_12585 [Phycisphaerales bacterium AB-hyl4]|uniref:Uncharacterized protein n=1 Tax=Natronomicrosphaera hydrolytica TaxID=3242702 RepID=A0ABV4U6F8_9BACT
MATLNIDAVHTVRLNEFIVLHGRPLKRDKIKKFDFRAKLDSNGSKGLIDTNRSKGRDQQSAIRNQKWITRLTPAYG